MDMERMLDFCKSTWKEMLDFWNFLFSAAPFGPLLVLVAWSLVYNWKAATENSLGENVGPPPETWDNFCNKIATGDKLW